MRADTLVDPAMNKHSSAGSIHSKPEITNPMIVEFFNTIGRFPTIQRGGVLVITEGLSVPLAASRKPTINKLWLRLLIAVLRHLDYRLAMSALCFWIATTLRSSRCRSNFLSVPNESAHHLDFLDHNFRIQSIQIFLRIR